MGVALQRGGALQMGGVLQGGVGWAAGLQSGDWRVADCTCHCGQWAGRGYQPHPFQAGQDWGNAQGASLDGGEQGPSKEKV